MSQKIKFVKSEKKDFYLVLKSRVYQSLKISGENRYGGKKIVNKASILFVVFLFSYGLIISGVVNNLFFFYFLWMILGFAMGGLGMNVMHDANHGCFSKNKKVNLLLGELMNLIGINPGIWKVQHNVLHHTYPNIQNYDEDLNMPGLLRMSPYTKKRSFHRYQQYYVWAIYLIGTLAKVLFRDFVVIKHLKELGVFKNDNRQYRKKYVEILFWKVIYFSYLIAIPILTNDVNSWVVCIGFVLMHCAMGCSLVIINFLAHFSDINEFISVAENNNNIQEDWAVHQLKTTINFGNDSKFLTWFSGGLNYQIEHHLFPEISHVHYSRICLIVKHTAEEFNIPYKANQSFFSAISSHFQLMKILGTCSEHDGSKWKL